MDEPAPPLLVTATLDAVSHAFFDGLRRQHFPPERNHLAAHVTLFHALPGGRLTEVRAAVRATAGAAAPMAAQVEGLRSLGGGVAYSLACTPLEVMRAALAEDFLGWLTRQDAHRFWAHVTVQNKVSPERARETQAILEQVAAPPVTVTGLALWFYRGGPWEPLSTHPFGGDE